MLSLRRRFGGRAVKRCFQRRVHRSGGFCERQARYRSAPESQSAPRFATVVPDRAVKSKTFEYITGLYSTGIFDFSKHQLNE